MSHGTMINNFFSRKREDDALCIPQPNCLEQFLSARYITVVAFGLIRVFLGFFSGTQTRGFYRSSSALSGLLLNNMVGCSMYLTICAWKIRGPGLPMPGGNASYILGSWLYIISTNPNWTLSHTHTHVVNIGRLQCKVIFGFPFHCFSLVQLHLVPTVSIGP